MNLLLALTLISTAKAADPTGADIVQKKFQDATFTAKVVKGDQGELGKISKDFGMSYRFKFVKAYLKEPLKMRLETNLDDTQMTYVLTDWVRYFKIPRAFINTKEDLRNKPGKMQTPLDYGIVTQTMLDELFTAKYVRTEREGGDYVFDLTYKKPKFDDTSRHRIWVDPQKRVVTRRDWFNQDGRQVGTFFYEEPKSQNGVWFPSRGTVRNMDNKVAGIIEYEKVAINTGLADSLFKP